MQTALVVDDDPVQIELSRTLLDTLGVKQTYAASNGAAAKTVLDGCDHIDFIILDLNMPDFDGVEFLDELRMAGCKVPILVVTAANPSVRRGAAALAAAYQLNLAAVVQKPLTIQKLVASLAHV